MKLWPGYDLRPGELFNGFEVSDTWWLSFASDSGNLGIAIVTGCDDIVQAVQKARRLGINPGGEVMGVPLPRERLHWLPEGSVERLLTTEEAKAIDALAESLSRQEADA